MWYGLLVVWYVFYVLFIPLHTLMVDTQTHNLHTGSLNSLA